MRGQCKHMQLYMWKYIPTTDWLQECLEASGGQIRGQSKHNCTCAYVPATDRLQECFEASGGQMRDQSKHSCARVTCMYIPATDRLQEHLEGYRTNERPIQILLHRCHMCVRTSGNLQTTGASWSLGHMRGQCKFYCIGVTCVHISCCSRLINGFQQGALEWKSHGYATWKEKSIGYKQLWHLGTL